MPHHPESTPGFPNGRHPFLRPDRIEAQMVLERLQSLQRGDGVTVHLIRLQNGKQPGCFFGQALRALGLNVSVVNFDFNGPIIHAVKLRLLPPARKEQTSGSVPWEGKAVRAGRHDSGRA
jgi:hypothetical protein